MRWVIYGLTGCLLGWISWTDYRQMKIGKKESLLLFALGTGWVLGQPEETWNVWQGLGGMAACAGLPELLNGLLFGFCGLGGGDIHFLLAMGWTLGLWDGLSALLIACSTTLCLAAGKQLYEVLSSHKTEAAKTEQRRKAVPFAPFLALGFMAELAKQLIW